MATKTQTHGESNSPGDGHSSHSCIAPVSAAEDSQPVSAKDEICRLREEVAALGAIASPNGGSQKIKTRAQLWRLLAVRQLERRRTAEEENVMLRGMVDVQIQEAKNLRRILKRRTKIQMMEKLLGIKCWPKPPQFGTANPVANERTQIFSQILQDVDQMYADVETLIQEMGMYNIPCPGRHRNAVESMLNGLCFELMEHYMLPFSTADTVRALWDTLGQLEFQDIRCVHGYKVDTQFRAQAAEQDFGTEMVDFIMSYSSGGLEWKVKCEKQCVSTSKKTGP